MYQRFQGALGHLVGVFLGGSFLGIPGREPLISLPGVLDKSVGPTELGADTPTQVLQVELSDFACKCRFKPESSIVPALRASQKVQQTRFAWGLFWSQLGQAGP